MWHHMPLTWKLCYWNEENMHARKTPQAYEAWCASLPPEAHVSSTRPVKRAAGTCAKQCAVSKKFRSHCMCDRSCWWDALWHLHNFCGSKARDQEIWRSSISQATICCKCYKVLATGQPVTMPGTHKLASKLPAKAVQKITFTEWMPH